MHDELWPDIQPHLRNVLERASARETAARTALGAVAQLLLKEFSIGVESWITALGGITVKEVKAEERLRHLAVSQLSCPDPEAERQAG